MFTRLSLFKRTLKDESKKNIRKQQGLHTDPKPIQQVHFNGNLNEKVTILSIIEESKETILDKELWEYCNLYFALI